MGVKMKNKHKISLVKPSFSNLLSVFSSYKLCSPSNKTESSYRAKTLLVIV